jgi:nitronate monooxygenase
MWPDKRICQLLGIEHPIILAPMAGTTTPALAAAVSNAGGLGAHGCASLTPEELARDAVKISRATNRPVNFNFFCHTPPEPTAAQHVAYIETMRPHYAAARAASPPPDQPGPVLPPFGKAHLEQLLARPPAVVSFHFGLPDPEAVAALKRKDCKILSTATTVAEARWLEARGVDAVIAQGWEAGGHRGVFLDVAHDAQIGLFALIPQVVDAVGVPVIAAGGIADGRGIAAAFTLGAAGVQIGTAFITADEANRKPFHHEALAAAGDDSTCITFAGSGRPARAHRTPWLDSMRDVAAAPFPLMYHYTAPLAKADPETHQFSLYGQSARLAPDGNAAERMQALVAEARAAMGLA